MSDRNKLTTDIERAVHKHVTMVKDSVVDFTHLYLRRNNIDVDRPTLKIVLEVVEKGIQSEHMNKLDMLVKSLDEALKKHNLES